MEYPQHMFLHRNKKKYLPDTHSYLDLWIILTPYHTYPKIWMAILLPDDVANNC